VKLKYLVIAGVVVVVGAAGVFGVRAWRSHTISHQAERNYQKALRLCDAGRYGEALTVIDANTPWRRLSGEGPKAGAERWVDLEVEALARLRQVPRLLWLYSRFPERFLRSEEASLLAGRALMQMREEERFSRLRGAWQGQETQKAAWLALDADRALSEGRRGDALELLQSRSFSGPEDCGRLARLALLHAKDLPRAWGYLQKAFAADPKNPDVRSFRGQVLEAAGRVEEARVEYVAAHLADPSDPLLRDQLGEFYRRWGNYDLALRTWAGGLTPPSFPFLWVKTWFWNRVASPAAVKWDSTAPPEGELRPLLDYLLALPEGRYWDEGAFEKVAGAGWLGQRRQEVFWLRLLQLLRDGKEEEAIHLLDLNPFHDRSWRPEIEGAIAKVLRYRKTRSFRPFREFPSVSGPIAGRVRHQLFEELDRLTDRRRVGTKGAGGVPEALARLILSEEAFAAVFLAGGWTEAALHLHRAKEIPPEFPAWVAYGLTQGVRFNRGVPQALEFAQRQPSTPPLDLLKGELWLESGDLAEARRQLEPLRRGGSDLGYRAAWLLSLASLGRGEGEAARRYVLENPRLARGVTGQEVLAKVALWEGRQGEAERIYRAIAEDSAEAKAYLARRAFQAQDWREARRLTLELMDTFPANLQVRANLKAIAQAEAKRRGGM